MFADLKAGGALRAAGVASSPIENSTPLDPQGLGIPEYYLSHGRNVNLSLRKHVVAAERAASHSLPSVLDHDQRTRTNMNPESASGLVGVDKISIMGSQDENSLFSSSMSDLFSKKCMRYISSVLTNSLNVFLSQQLMPEKALELELFHFIHFYVICFQG